VAGGAGGHPGSTRRPTSSATWSSAINKLKGHRAVATCYDKRDYIFR
jgi:hypothetical protein